MLRPRPAGRRLGQGGGHRRRGDRASASTEAVDRKMAEKAANYGAEVMRMAEKSAAAADPRPDLEGAPAAARPSAPGHRPARLRPARSARTSTSARPSSCSRRCWTRLREQIIQLLAHIEIRQPEPTQAGSGASNRRPPTPQGQPAQRLQAAMAAATALPTRRSIPRPGGTSAATRLPVRLGQEVQALPRQARLTLVRAFTPNVTPASCRGPVFRRTCDCGMGPGSRPD